MKLRSLTKKLLSGTPITPESHPRLVALLDFAARAPCPAESWATKKRHQRDWQELARNFHACVEKGVQDEDLKRVFHEMRPNDQPRKVVSDALIRLSQELDALISRKVEDVSDLLKLRSDNRMPDLLNDKGQTNRRIESGILPGNRIVISSDLEGLKLFTTFRFDAHGQLLALGHRESLAGAESVI